jgi:hypothetical protein
MRSLPVAEQVGSTSKARIRKDSGNTGEAWEGAGSSRIVEQQLLDQGLFAGQGADSPITISRIATSTGSCPPTTLIKETEDVAI